MERKVKAERKKSSENMKFNIIYCKRLWNKYLFVIWLTVLGDDDSDSTRTQRTNFPAPLLGDHILCGHRHIKAVWILLHNKAIAWQNQRYTWATVTITEREKKENKKIFT